MLEHFKNDKHGEQLKRKDHRKTAIKYLQTTLQWTNDNDNSNNQLILNKSKKKSKKKT